jgi:hypothetical protein
MHLKFKDNVTYNFKGISQILFLTETFIFVLENESWVDHITLEYKVRVLVVAFK